MTASFCLGIILAGRIPLGFWALFAAAGTLLFFSFFLLRPGRLSSATLLLFILLLGALSLKNAHTLPRGHVLEIAPYPSNKIYTVRGLVASPPKARGKYIFFIMKATGIGEGARIRDCRGSILVVFNGRRNFEYGDELFLRGNLSRMRPSNYLHNQGIYLMIRIKDDASAIKGGPGRSVNCLRHIIRFSDGLQEIILRQHADFSSGIVNAMVLGRKDFIPPGVYKLMIKTGTVHILVVSGFNVGIIAFISMLILKVIGLGRRIRILITVPVLILYCLITGSSTPVVRATVMGVTFLTANLILREPDIYNALCLAALFILALDPRQFFDVGFQLSFASVLAIICFSGFLKPRLGIATLKPKACARLAEAGMVSFCAWLGTSLPVGYYFRIFSPVTVLANIIIVPLATLITLGGLSVLFTAPLFPALSSCIAATDDLLVALLLAASSFLARIPYACLSF